MKRQPKIAKAPQMGDRIRFWPDAFVRLEGQPNILWGKIIYINRLHRYYTVEAEVSGVTIRESFRFEEGLLYD